MGALGATIVAAKYSRLAHGLAHPSRSTHPGEFLGVSCISTRAQHPHCNANGFMCAWVRSVAPIQDACSIDLISSVACCPSGAAKAHFSTTNLSQLRRSSDHRNERKQEGPLASQPDSQPPSQCVLPANAGATECCACTCFKCSK